jgi:hypothetical protein
MVTPHSSIWADAPKLRIPDIPALFCDSEDLWLCYAVADTSPKCYAVVQFIDVSAHRLSPVNDEGLGKHPYFKAGLEFYAFNEIVDSFSDARHWVVTFKDNTLDVVASDAKVVAADLQARRPMEALISFLREQPPMRAESSSAK